jgi:hypothetical protein
MGVERESDAKALAQIEQNPDVRLIIICGVGGRVGGAQCVRLLLLTADKMSTREINHKCAPADACPQKGSRRFLLCVCGDTFVILFCPQRAVRVVIKYIDCDCCAGSGVGNCCSQFRTCRPKLTSNNF